MASLYEGSMRVETVALVARVAKKKKRCWVQQELVVARSWRMTDVAFLITEAMARLHFRAGSLYCLPALENDSADAQWVASGQRRLQRLTSSRYGTSTRLFVGCDEDAKAFRRNARSNKTVFKYLKQTIGSAAGPQ